MKRMRYIAIGWLGLMLSACVAQPSVTHQAPPQSLIRASAEVDDARLLDVWIENFEPVAAPKQANEMGTDDNKGIRQAEARFVSIHLRDTLQATGFWGAVRVVPQGTVGGELLVAGTLQHSDGRVLTVDVQASDATGRQWLNRTYSAVVNPSDYDGLERGEQDAFQNVYNRIANDLARIQERRSADEIRHVRDASTLRFAADLAPTPYGDYFSQDRRGQVQIERLPAKDDPLFMRVSALKDRDDLLVDTLNAHYDQFYNDMWDSYVNWRKASLAESLALAQIKREANARKMAGAAAILGAIAIDLFGSRRTRQHTGTLQTAMVVGGAMAIKSGIDRAAEGDIHEAAIEELSQSFDAEVSPMVVQVDGEIIELKGSADAQYTRWRQLLHRRYAADAGTDPMTMSVDDEALAGQH